MSLAKFGYKAEDMIILTNNSDDPHLVPTWDNMV